MLMQSVGQVNYCMRSRMSTNEMHRYLHFTIWTIVILIPAPSGFAQEPKEQFESDVETVVKPWTHLEFYNNPKNFKFAIVSDRAGGVRPGIFADAVNKLNLIMPEFVMSV